MKVSLGIYEASLCLIPGLSSLVSCFSDFCPLYLRAFCLNGYSSVNKAKSNQISSNEGLNLLFSMRNHKNLTALTHELHVVSLFPFHHLLVLTGNPEPWFCSPPEHRTPHTEPTPEESRGAYLAQARGVLHLVDGPQQTGRGRGRGGLQNAAEAGREERRLRGGGRGRPVFLLFRRQI